MNRFIKRSAILNSEKYLIKPLTAFTLKQSNKYFQNKYCYISTYLFRMNLFKQGVFY